MYKGFCIPDYPVIPPPVFAHQTQYVVPQSDGGEPESVKFVRHDPNLHAAGCLLAPVNRGSVVRV